MKSNPRAQWRIMPTANLGTWRSGFFLSVYVEWFQDSHLLLAEGEGSNTHPSFRYWNFSKHTLCPCFGLLCLLQLCVVLRDQWHKALHIKPFPADPAKTVVCVCMCACMVEREMESQCIWWNTTFHYKHVGLLSKFLILSKKK